MDNGQWTMDNGQRCPQRATSRDSLRPVPVWVPGQDNGQRTADNGQRTTVPPKSDEQGQPPTGTGMGTGAGTSAAGQPTKV